VLQVVARPVQQHVRPPTKSPPTAGTARRRADSKRRSCIRTALGAWRAREREILFLRRPEGIARCALAIQFQNNVDLVIGSRFFGFFSKGLLLSMNWLHDALKLSYGLAIIANYVHHQTAVLAADPASTRSMKRMAALQPQMKALQEKYKDDPAR
jgi:hypothetical protein